MRTLAALALLACLAFPASARADGAIYGSAVCGSGNAVDISWTYLEDAPYGHPEWVGYDVYRRSSEPCGNLVRLNAESIPRGAGNHTRSWNDVIPASAKSFEYQVRAVDLLRHPLDFYGIQGYYAVSCPTGSAPVAHGMLEDYGWALFITPCPESCAPANYIEYPSDDLRALAGTGQAVRLFGAVGCGTIEGCAVSVDHFELAGCGAVPTLAATWGKLKANYR